MKEFLVVASKHEIKRQIPSQKLKNYSRLGLLCLYLLDGQVMSPKVTELKFSPCGRSFPLYRSASVLVLQFRLQPCHNFEIAGIGIELNVQCIHGLPTHTTKVQLIPLEHDQSQQTNSKFCIIIAKLLKSQSMPPMYLKLPETMVFAGSRWKPQAVF